MTVAAVILSATSEGALANTLGQPRVRRLVDIAWSGGALPVVVVSPDEHGAVAAALVGSEAVYGAPAGAAAGDAGARTGDAGAPAGDAGAPAGDAGAPAGDLVRGAELALAEVRETSAVLAWPARMTWVGPETVTSLIEAHGTDSATILRPAWEGTPGWPVLVPIASLGALRGMAPGLTPRDAIDDIVAAGPSRLVEMGDPGVVHDADTPFADLPPYEGPPDPPAGHTHEWGDGVEEDGVDEDVPGEGRGLAPFPQAADDTAVDLG